MDLTRRQLIEMGVTSPERYFDADGNLTYICIFTGEPCDYEGVGGKGYCDGCCRCG